MPATKALDDLRRSMLIQSGIIVLLLLMLGGVVFVDRHNDSDRRARESASETDRRAREEKSKIDARVESTRLYNKDQTRNRDFQIQNILTLSSLSGRDVEVIKNDPKFAQYQDFVNKSYPFRQTSVECVTALFDPDIPDCAEAINESGDPP